MFHMLSKRYYLLSGNCMYYYTHKSDVRPKGVIFLTGFIIEKLKDDEMAHKGYYGFEIMHQDMTTGEHHRSAFCNDIVLCLVLIQFCCVGMRNVYFTARVKMNEIGGSQPYSMRRM